MLLRFPRNTKSLTDEELLELYRSSKDIIYLGDLYSRHAHLVYGLCLKYLSDRERSKDAVMEIFEILITRVPQHDIRNFKNWLYVLSKNYCLMELRSDQARVKRNVIWTVNFMESATELHPIDEDEEKRNAALKDCIDTLKRAQKICIKLFYYENKCYAEIANFLNIDEKKVKSHLQNGKRNLKICLDKKHVKEKKKY